MRPGCIENPVPGCDEDVQSGWFMWALRDAAVAAGHYRSATETDRFWRRMAGEINAACDARVVACTKRRDTLQPPLRGGDLGPILHETGQALLAAVKLGPPTLGTYPTNPFADLRTYRRVVRAGPVAPPGLDESLVPPLRGPRLVLARLLCRLMPWFAFVFAPIGALWVAVSLGVDLRHRTLRPLTLLGAAVLLALGCRLAMLGVLSATAIRLQFRYVSPCFPLVLLLAALPLAHSLGRRSMTGFSTPRQVSSGTSRIRATASPMQGAGPQA